MVLNKAMQVFIGSLLGDGNIFLNKEGYLSYSEIHSLKQKGYLLWKMRLMSKILNFAGSPYIFNKYDKRTKKEYPTIKINSSNSKKLKKYHKIFYKKGRKIVPKAYLYNLNKLGLAILYQDDGTYHYGSYTCSLATDSFSYKEHTLIKEFLKEKYNIESTICHRKEGYYIFLKRKNADKFLKTIKNYIHQSMLYKLGHLYEPNNPKIINSLGLISKNKKKYYQKNKEKEKRRTKKWREKNPNYSKEYNEKYYKKKKEGIKKQHKKHYKKNKEEILKRNRDYWNRNKEFLNKKRRLKRLNENRKNS